MADELWDKFEKSVAALQGPTGAAQDSPPEETEEEKAAAAKRRRRVRRGLDLAGTLFWTYAILKVFFFDVDRWIVEAVAPGAVGLLDYRAFVYLLALILLLVFVKKRLIVIVVLLYILFFPFVVLCWKVPAFLYRRKSWPLTVALMNLAAVAMRDFKYSLVSKTLAALAAVLILASAPDALVILSAVYIAGLIVFSFARLVKRSFERSWFLRKQREAILNVEKSTFVQKAIVIDNDLKASNIQLFSQEQVGRLGVTISMGLTANRFLYFWAYQLENYRRASASYFLSALTYLWMLAGIILGVSLINQAILDVAPGQFSFASYPSIVAVILYSFSGLLRSEGGGITAQGDWAYGVELAGGILGVVLLTTFAVNLVLVFKREREDTATRELVSELKERAREQGAQLQQEYNVSLDEAERRMRELKAGYYWMLGFLFNSIPEDFLRPVDPDDPDADATAG